MTNLKNLFNRKSLVIVGVGLIVIAIVILAVSQWNIHASKQNTQEYLSTIGKLIPNPQGALPQERSDNAMPTLSIDGADFVGILEFPKYESSLPVCDDWGKPSKYPCRFSGSIYNRTMQIGATSQNGQYDFYSDISVGDSVSFTDMEGNRYSYTVTDIRYEKSADQTALQRNDAALTLFIKNIYAFEYIIIYCDVSN